MKQIVIIKDSKSKIKINSDHIEVKSIYENRIIGLKNINQLYINQQIQIVPSQLIRISEFIQVFFIDHYGHILGAIKREKNEKL